MEKTKKPKIYIGKILLGIVLKIKAKLLEPQFFDPSHNGVCLGSYRICFLDICNGRIYKYFGPKNQMVVSHVNEKSGESKSTVNCYNRSIGWSINRKIHGFRSIIVAKTHFSVWVL